MGVSYGGEKYTTFAATHAPVQIDLQLAFKELELLNRQAVAGESAAAGSQWPQNTWDGSVNEFFGE